MCAEVAPAKPTAPGSKNAVADKGKHAPSKPAGPTAPLELRYDEKLSTTVGRNGDVRSLEVLGMLMLKVLEEGAAFVRFKMNTQNALTQRPGITLQVCVRRDLLHARLIHFFSCNVQQFLVSKNCELLIRMCFYDVDNDTEYGCTVV